MQLSHTSAALSAVFDEPNLVGSAGLVPALALAEQAGLSRLADEWLTVPGSAGRAGAKVATLVGGMLAGADSIDDLDVLRHGGMGHLFGGVRAPSTVGVFLRSFTFGTFVSWMRSPPDSSWVWWSRCRGCWPARTVRCSSMSTTPSRPSTARVSRARSTATPASRGSTRNWRP